MNILFVYPDIKEYAILKGMFYAGIASLSAILKKETPYSVSLFHITKAINKEDFLHKIKEKKPDLIAFSSTTNMYPYVKRWSGWVKNRYKDIKIICGGVHPTIYPQEVLSNPFIDIVCIGEGEYALIELCDKMNKGQEINRIKGLWVRDGDKVYKNEVRPLMPYLDALPFPDRAIFDYPNLHHESQGRAVIMVSRGCPYECRYCCNGALKRIYPSLNNKYVRFRSVPNVIDELRQILKTYPFIKSFAFDDDILPLDRDWFEDFAVQYKEEINIPYDCNLRPNLVNEEVVSFLKESGCYQVRMGIESGNDFIRNEILGRYISRGQITKAFRLCKEAGIKIYSFNMLGLPFENLEMMLDTIKLNAELDSDTNQVTIFYPYKKTPLYEICEREHLIDTQKEVTDYSQDTILRFRLPIRNRIIFIQRFFIVIVKFYKIIYKLPKKISINIQACFEKAVFSDLSALSILPILNIAVILIMKNKALSSIARVIKRKL